MKKTSFIAGVLLSCCLLSAFTIIQESTYQAKRIDNNETKRIRALVKIQKILMEAVGMNILYTAKSRNDSSYVKLEYFTPKEIGGIVKEGCNVEILQERDDGDSYYVKSQLSADEDKILADFATRDFSAEQMREIHGTYKKNKEISKKLSRLSEEFDQADNEPEKEDLRKKYEVIVRRNSPEKWFLRKSINSKFDELEAKLPYLQNLNIKDNFENIISFQDSVSAIRPEKFPNVQAEIDFYEKKTVSQPQDISYLISLGFAYLKNDSYEKADSCFRKAVEPNIKNAEAYFGLGIIAFENGKYEDAVNEYENAVTIDSLNDNYFLNLGVALEYLGKNDKAFDSYEKAIELNPANSRAYYNIGMLYQDLDNREKSEYYLKKAAQLGHAKARENLQKRNLKW